MSTAPHNTQAGLALARIRLGGPVEDGGGRYRCQGCGQMVPLSHTCTPPTPAAILAGAFPWHGRMAPELGDADARGVARSYRARMDAAAAIANADPTAPGFYDRLVDYFRKAVA